MAERRRSAWDGFTLIELMVIVTVLAVLTAVAIPKFAELMVRAKESGVLKKLGQLRSAVSIYYSDNEGVFPSNLAVGLTASGRYISEMPTAEVPRHGGSPGHSVNNGVRTVGGVYMAVNDGASVQVWIYSSTEGGVAVNCSHLDTRGNVWSHW